MATRTSSATPTPPFSNASPPMEPGSSEPTKTGPSLSSQMGQRSKSGPSTEFAISWSPSRATHKIGRRGTMERDRTLTLAGWFLSGAVLGGVVAILLTPKTGAEARENLLDRAERGRKSLLDSGQEIFERGRELFERGREIAEEAARVLENGRTIAEKKVEDRF